jgi:hypothetical protein
MKLFKIVLVVAAFLFVFQANAQITSKSQSNSKENLKDLASNAEEFKLYGEVSVSEISGRFSLKVSFDPIIDRMGSDKELIGVAQHIENHKFSSLGEALNVLSSHGWHVEMVWTTLGTLGQVQHFLISNEIEKLSPVSPWLDKGSRGVSSKGRRN